MTRDYPKKRDWKKGVPQIGVFLRLADGGTISCVMDRASPDEQAFAVALLRGLRHLPESVVRIVREEIGTLPPGTHKTPRRA